VTDESLARGNPHDGKGAASRRREGGAGENETVLVGPAQSGLITPPLLSG